MMPHGGMNCVSPMGSPMGNGPMCSGPPGPPSMSSPIIDIRPINSPMCQMNNGNQPPQQPPQQQQQQQRPPSGPPGMNQMSSGMPGMSPNDMCKGPPVNANGPVRPPHHQHPHPHPHPHPPMQHQHAMQHPPHGYPPPKPMPVSAGKVRLRYILLSTSIQLKLAVFQASVQEQCCFPVIFIFPSIQIA